jgi:hypothetical protein
VLIPHARFSGCCDIIWAATAKSRPMLAFLVASARDPFLRDMTPFIQAIPSGQTVVSTDIVQELAAKYP